MKRKIREIAPYKVLYRDDKTGIAWIEDGSSGACYSIHANIDSSGSIRGMKQRGYWGKNDRCVRTAGCIYNIDTLVCNQNNPMEQIVFNECCCEACRERRNNRHR